MDELRRNNKVKVEFKNNIIEGIIIDYEPDRVMIEFGGDAVYLAREIDELDELVVTVLTKLGLKKMISLVISKLNVLNRIVIENTPTLPVNQKREYVRVFSDMIFKISKDDKLIPCICINISAGGIAFCTNSAKFEIGDEVDIILPEYEFGKEIIAKAEIIKRNEEETVAKFSDIDKHDEDKILKFVFKLISEK